MIGGARAGLRTIMVLSGSTGRAEAEAYAPDLIFRRPSLASRSVAGGARPRRELGQASRRIA